MSSNEEYLDSLLKSVTEKEQAGDVNTEAGEEIKNAEQDDFSSDDLEQLLANEESAEYGMQEETEKALSDPGALFFSDEEESQDDSFLAIEDIPEEAEEYEAELESDIFEENSSTEDQEADETAEDAAFVEEVGEEDISATTNEADGIEDVIAAADSAAEETPVTTDETDGIEDVIATADSVEEETFMMEEEAEDLPEASALEDEGFKEISDLLASSGESDDDMFAMLTGAENEEEAADIDFFDEEIGEETAEESKKERKKKEKERKKKEKLDRRSKRNKKRNVNAEEAAGAEENGEETEEVVSISLEDQGKKPGIFRRFIDFLMEEDEEEDDGKVRIPIDGDSDLFLSEDEDENAAILDELAKEDEAKKSKKADKKKKKKGKKGKNAEENPDEDGVEEEEGKKKEKKEKKKKKAAVEEELIPEVPDKKLSVKKIEITAVFCLTVLAAILLTVHLLPPALEKNKARDAYYAKDYEKVVEGFYNEKLNDSDSLMYNRAYTILRLQRKIDGYNNYMRMGKETEALNQLIEGVIRYEEIYSDAEQYNVTSEVNELYQMITDALENKYGISTTVAEGVYAMEDKLSYTLKLEAIINGTEYTEPVYDNAEEAEITEE